MSIIWKLIFNNLLNFNHEYSIKNSKKDSKIEDFESRIPDKETAISFITKLQDLDLRNYELGKFDEMIDEVFHIISFEAKKFGNLNKFFRYFKEDFGSVERRKTTDNR